MKERLLVVPHMYAENVRIREIEFARRLTGAFEVFCLRWDDALSVGEGNSIGRRWRQVRAEARSVFAPRRRLRQADGITYVEAPLLQAVVLVRLLGPNRGWAACRWFNRRILDGLVKELGIQHVLLASAKFAPAVAPPARLYYDLVDWFEEEHASPAVVASTRALLQQAARRAEAVFAVSEPLAEKLRDDAGIAAIPLPNGADLAELRSVSADKVQAVRERWGLTGRFVVGYIGNHGSFTGVDFVVEMFRALRRRMPDAALLIVGPADYWLSRLGPLPEPGVIFTGAIPPAEMPAYFNAINLGVLAQYKSAGTEFAFQIKVVEYSACRKFVLSTPLLTWQRLGWPNVHLVEREVNPWVEAVCRLRGASWQPEWDGLVEPYDWTALARRIAGVMRGR